MNPVILLDEVDKVGADGAAILAALLEVLDPAQNSTFRDHYLDVEVDLSQVFFIATANIAETIPGPLLDRMEVIRFDGYTTDEKVAIARGYLWPRQRERAGLQEDEVSIADDVLETVISEYTREAGVRQLERELGSILRKTATKIVSEDAETPVAVDVEAVRDALGPGFPRGGGADRGARCRHRPRGQRDRRRRSLRRGDRHAGRGPRADGPARRRHEGVRADRALRRSLEADRLGIEQSAFEQKFTCTCRPGRSRGRPSAGAHGDTPRVAALRRPVYTVGMTGG